MLAILGRSRALCWRSWAALGPCVGGLGPLLGPMLAVLGCSWCLSGRCGAEKCEEHGYLENVLISRAGVRSAAWGSVLSRSWDLCWRSWAAFVPYDVGLGPLLGPKSAVLGSFRGPSGRSWDVLGEDQTESGPNPSGKTRSGRSWEGSRPKSGPNPSGKAI